MQNAVTMDLRPSNGSDSSDVDAEISDGFSLLDSSHRDVGDEAESNSLLRRAEVYQAYMKQVPIPKNRGSVIPFTSWVGLSISIKKLYSQSLHYLTNVLLKSWDQSRFGADSEDQTLDSIIHPLKAEATIWLLEETHRITASHLHIAHLWKSDPLYHSFIDPIFPKSQSLEMR